MAMINPASGADTGLPARRAQRSNLVDVARSRLIRIAGELGVPAPRRIISRDCTPSPELLAFCDKYRVTLDELFRDVVGTAAVLGDASHLNGGTGEIALPRGAQ